VSDSVETHMGSAILIMFLVFFTCLGIANVIKPAWFVKRSGVRKGGELLTDWNELSFQIGGVLLAGIAFYFLYSLLSG